MQVKLSAMKKNTSKCLWKEAFFGTLSMEKREKKSVAGHESDKLIESYSAQPAIVRVIFHYQAI